MSEQHLYDKYPSTITLTLDDDTEVTCSILKIFSMEEQAYIALLPPMAEGDSEQIVPFEGESSWTDPAPDPEEPYSEVWLFRFRLEDGSPVLDNIMDDDEYMAVVQLFDEIRG